jgi:hypothetical protein
MALIVETPNGVSRKVGVSPIGFDETGTSLLMKRHAVGLQTRLKVSKPVPNAGRQAEENAPRAPISYS